MGYNYETEKSALFTDDGQRMFLAIRDEVLRLLKLTEAISMGRAMSYSKQSGSTWMMMACVDRMVELGDIKEITYGQCAGQHRVFVRFQ